MNKIHRNDLSSLSVYKINEFANNYALNDKLVDLFIEIINNDVIHLLNEDETEFQKGKTEGYEEGYDEGFREGESGGDSVPRRDYDTRVRDLKEEIEKVKKDSYARGYKHGADWKYPEQAHELLSDYLF
jgi:hypothetical protein